MFSLALSLACLTIGTAFLWNAWGRRRTNPKGLPSPPGPRPLPIIGNARDIPTEGLPWKAYTSMSQRYGDVIYLSVLGKSMLILSSMEAITDFLDKRSLTYSDRSKSPMIELCGLGFDWIFAAYCYGERWRKTRKAFYQYFNANVVDEYQPVQTKQVRTLLKCLLQTPEDFPQHIRHFFGATIMKITYGIDVKETNDEYIHNAEQATKGFHAVSHMGKYYVEFLPFLKYVPAWVPGASFQKEAAYWRRFVAQLRDKPFDAVKEALVSSSIQTRSHFLTATPSIAVTMLENLTETEDIARDSTGTTYAAGADTTVSAVLFFFLAMRLYPEVQKKAQAELDAVIGPERLPEFSDRPSLPYIEALLKEVLRWRPAVPLEDDEYRGYFIPKETIVIANAWSLLHDPTVYPDPDTFNPERFLKDGKLNPDAPDPTAVCLGFGRRICPGRHFALTSLYTLFSSVLHAFDITPALDHDETPIPVRSGMTSAIVSYPTPFACSITVRSSVEALILESQHS